jgi:GNAT superfamily N-acetyltransferase
LNPFYLGLYGGSELPGVLQSDVVAQRLFASHGYREIDRTLVLHRTLSDFQAVTDRSQMQIRRRAIVEVIVDPPTRTWWEACTLGEFDLTRFELVPRGGGAPMATATFRSLDPSGIGGSARATGLIDLNVDPSFRRRGLAMFLLSEAFRQFIRDGVTLVEAQVMQQNVAAQGVYAKLGFREVNQGSVFRKEHDGQ